MAHAKGDARRLRAALDACGLALLAPKFAEHGVDDSCLAALEDDMNVGPAGTLPRAAFNWRDPTVLAAVGQLGGSFDDVGESAQAWPAPARFGEEAPTE